MPKYYVLINGRNFMLKKQGRLGKFGFFTARCIVADGPAQAEAQAVKIVRGDAALKEMIHNTRDDQPMLYVEEISRLESFNDIPKARQDFSWYPQEE